MRVNVESESRQVTVYRVVCDEHGVVAEGIVGDYHTAHDARYVHEQKHVATTAKAAVLRNPGSALEESEQHPDDKSY